MILGLSAPQAHCAGETGFQGFILRSFAAMMVGSSFLSINWTSEQLKDLELALKSNTTLKDNQTIKSVEYLGDLSILSNTVAIFAGTMGLGLNSERDWDALLVAAGGVSLGFISILTQNIILWSVLSVDLIPNVATNGLYSLLASGAFGAPLLSGFLVSGFLGIQNYLDSPASLQ